MGQICQEIKEIETWLTAYTDFEDLTREYYLEYGRAIPSSAIPDAFYKPVSLHPMDLKNVTFSQETSRKLIGRSLGQTYLEHQYFQPGLDLFIQKHPRYSESDIHSHQFFELSYVYSGHCTHTFYQGQTQKKEQTDLEEGDLLLIPPGKSHRIQVLSDSLILNIGIRQSTFRAAFSHNIPENSFLGNFFTDSLLPANEKIRFLRFHAGEADSKNSDSIRSHVQDLCLAYCSDTPYSRARMNLQLSLLFVTLLENYSGSALISHSEEGIPEQMPAMIHYLEENYRNTSLKEAASRFGYSEDHLNLIFEKATSFTVGELLRNLKMQKAEDLLKNTDTTVAAIAEYIGYQDTTGFNRSFKKHTGMTPSAYRRRFR